MKAYNKLEVRTQIQVVGFVVVVLVALSFAGWATKVPALSVIASLSGLVAWCGLTGYTFWRIYSFYILGQDFVYQIADMPRYAVLRSRSYVSMALLFGFWLVSLPFASTFWQDPGKLSLLVPYLFISKVASLASFFALAALLVVVCKGIRRPFIALATIVVLYTLVTGVWGWLLVEFTMPDGWTWAMGISSEVTAVNRHVNILPVSFEAPSPESLSDTVSYLPVAINGVAAACFGFVAWRLSDLRDRTADFYLR